MNTRNIGVDEDGYIITEVSAQKITAQFRPIVDDALATVREHFVDQLESIYLYGSLATGKAIIGKSDADILLIFKEVPDTETANRVGNIAHELSTKYRAVLREVGIEHSHIDEVRSEKEQNGFLCFIKHLCVCVYGTDLTADTQRFKPTREVAIGFNGDIGKVLLKSRARVESAKSDGELKKFTQQLSKKIVRTGFSLVMADLESWVTDLKSSADCFISVHSEKAEDMLHALAWAQEGTLDKDAVLKLSDSFGSWLIREFDRFTSTSV